MQTGVPNTRHFDTTALFGEDNVIGECSDGLQWITVQEMWLPIIGKATSTAEQANGWEPAQATLVRRRRNPASLCPRIQVVVGVGVG